MLANYLVCLSALVIAMLGVAHLFYTFSGKKLVTRDADLQTAMKADSPGISSETTMWKAWIGFNASHSLGTMLFGLIYSYLAMAQPDLLFGSVYLSVVGFAMLVSLLVLGKRYWFSVPYRGIVFSLACYTVGQIIARV